MNEKLKSYLEKCNPATVDQATLDDLRGAMERAVPKIAENIRQRERLAAHLERAVPKIAENIRQRERLAAHLRVASSKPPRSNSNKQG